MSYPYYGESLPSAIGRLVGTGIRNLAGLLGWSPFGLAQVLAVAVLLGGMGIVTFRVPAILGSSVPGPLATALKKEAERLNWYKGDWKQGIWEEPKGSAPWWILVRGTEADGEYLNRDGGPQSKRCTIIYAAPATPIPYDRDYFEKRSPYLFWYFVVWPEVARVCKVGP
jgi:hypothetical protein